MNKTELLALVEKAATALEAAQSADAATINKCLADLADAKARLAAHEALNVKSAAPAVHTRDIRKSATDNLLVQKAVAAVVAKHDQVPVSVAAERVYGADAMVTKAENPVMGARNQTGFAQEILTEQVAGFQQLLQPSSFFAGAFGGALSLNMVNGSVTIPYRDASVKAVAKENMRTEKGKIKMQSVKIATKAEQGSLLGSIIAVSNELLAAQAYASVAQIITTALGEDLTNVVDEMVLNTGTAIANAPTSILSGLTPTKIGTVAADIRTGLAEALGDLLDKPNNFAISDLAIGINPKTRLALLAMRNTQGAAEFPEVADGQLMGVTLVESGNVAKGDLVVVHRPSLFSGMGAVSIDTSEQAVVFDAADAPVSLWAQNLTGYRLRAGISFGSWRDSAVSHVQIAAKA